jgi:drug/metabolite transporter (DMT)-like permease
MTLLAEGSDGPAGAVLVTMLALRVSQVALVLPAALVRGELSRGTGWVAALPLLLVVGAVDVTANSAFAFATRGGLLSVVAVLGSLYPVVTVLLARQVHRERLRAVQVAGVAGTLLGVALLSVG